MFFYFLNYSQNHQNLHPSFFRRPCHQRSKEYVLSVNYGEWSDKKHETSRKCGCDDGEYVVCNVLVCKQTQIYRLVHYQPVSLSQNLTGETKYFLLIPKTKVNHCERNCNACSIRWLCRRNLSNSTVIVSPNYRMHLLVSRRLITTLSLATIFAISI